MPMSNARNAGLARVAALQRTRDRGADRVNTGAWMRANLVVTGLALESALVVPIGAVAGWLWLAAVAALFAAGASTAALMLGGMLVAVCGVVTATNFYVPSR